MDDFKNETLFQYLKSTSLKFGELNFKCLVQVDLEEVIVKKTPDVQVLVTEVMLQLREIRHQQPPRLEQGDPMIEWISCLRTLPRQTL
jgi:hypothetical protein